MSKDELLQVAEVVAEARRLSGQMRSVLDNLDNVLDRAADLETDEIARLEEQSDA